MKKILILMLTIILATASMLLMSCEEEEETSSSSSNFTSTDESESPHIHAYSEWQTVKESTCKEKGSRKKVCDCGDIVAEELELGNHTEQILQAAGPTCTEPGLTEGKKCSVCGEILVAQNEIPATGIHTYENGKCSGCNETQPSEGLEFKLNASTNTYIVTGIGTCTDKNIIIPSTYEDKPVTAIGEKAFDDCYSFESIKIPSSVETIESYAFRNCLSLESITIDGHSDYKSIDGVLYNWNGTTLICYPAGKADTSFTIPSSVTRIENYAFYGCYSLESITIPNSVTSVINRAFEHCDSLKNVYISDIASWCNISFYDSYSNPLYNGANLYLNETLVTNLLIPSTVTSIGNYAFYGYKPLTSVTIPNSVTSIGSNAFYNCTLLNSVTIGSGVTSIGNCAFEYCTSLTSITIPNSITLIGFAAFRHCHSLINITLGSGVVSIGEEAFLGCDSLTNIVIPNSVASIGYHAFEYCYSLVSVTIGSSVTSIGNGAFGHCYSLVEVYNLSSLDVSAEVIHTSLDEPSILEKVDDFIFMTLDDNYYLVKYTGDNTATVLPANYNNKSYAIHPYAFCFCDSLTSVTIPNSVTSIGSDAFYNCTLLNSVTIGNGVTSILNCTFQNCDSLKSITIPTNVTSIGEHAFEDCDLLENIIVDDGNTTYKSIDGVLYSKDSSTLICYPEGKTDTSFAIPNSVETIGRYAFENCYSLESVIIPNSVTSIEGSAFEDCFSLKIITIPDSVTSIGFAAFRFCYSLTNVTIPSRVKTIGEYTFYCCKSLTSVKIGSGVTTIKSNAFGDCDLLENIIVDDGNTTYKSINGILYSKDGTTLICYPAGKTDTSFTIPNSVETIESNAFQNCSSITSITIPNSVTSIEYNALYACASLTIYCEEISQPSTWSSSWNCSNCPVVWNCNNNDVANDGNTYTVIDGIRYGIKDGTSTVVAQPKSITKATIQSNITYKGQTYSVTSIGDYAFNNCYSLTNVTIPSSVTSIGDYAFNDCDSLVSITIPSSVTSIGDHAFDHCYSLVEVYNLSSLDVSAKVIHASLDESSILEKVDDFIFMILKDNYYLVKYIGNNTELTLPSNYKGNSYHIYQYAFYNCDSLTSVTIPNSVNSIEHHAFADCDLLKSITISNSVNSIEKSAFFYCLSLSIYCEAESKPSGWYSSWNVSNRPVYWYSENEPTQAGNYWHYGANGEIVVW